jgi:hypothetical protein
MNARARNLQWNRMATDVLAAMRRGASLHVEFRETGPRWSFSDGRRVNHHVAKIVIANPEIVGDNDALFPGITTSQTYRASQAVCPRSAPLRILRLTNPTQRSVTSHEKACDHPAAFTIRRHADVDC